MALNHVYKPPLQAYRRYFCKQFRLSAFQKTIIASKDFWLSRIRFMIECITHGVLQFCAEATLNLDALAVLYISDALHCDHGHLFHCIRSQSSWRCPLRTLPYFFHHCTFEVRLASEPSTVILPPFEAVA
jgi:hypothetical protein